MPSDETYGPSPIYSFNNKNKTPENIQNYSITYHNNAVVEKMFKSINRLAQDKIDEFAIFNLVKNCTVKPTFNTREDGSKVTYLKLNTFRANQDNKLQVLTKITDFNSSDIDFGDTISKYGLLVPMIHISKIYFGPHGSSEYGASLQTKVVRFQFKRISDHIPDFPSSDEVE